MFYLAHVAHVTVSASWKKLHVSVKVPLLLYMDHTFFFFVLSPVSHLIENCNVNKYVVFLNSLGSENAVVLSGVMDLVF